MKLAFTVFLAIGLHAAAYTQVCSMPVTVGSNQSAATRTRNTAELNQLFVRIHSGALACHRVVFPEGIVEINGVVNVFNGSAKPAPVRAISGAYGAVDISGAGRDHSIVMQTVSNEPVFRWNSNNLYVSGIYVHDLGLDNSNTAAPYHPQQWGMEFRCTPDGSGGNSWGFANSQFERLSVGHMYVGLGLYVSKGGACGLWSTHFQDLKFYNSQRNAIFLAGGSIGQPANVLERIDVLQENNPPPNVAAAGDSVDSAALMAVGLGGVLIDSLDIEGWNSPSSEIEVYGGSATVINNLRIEHAVFTGCNPAIGFFDGDVILNGTSISWDKFENTCLSNVFSLAGAGASLSVNGLSLASTSGPPRPALSLWRVDKPNPPAKIFASNLNLNGIASEWMPSTTASLGGTLYSRYEIDHMPPQVDRLPPAGAGYVGRSFFVSSGQTETVYVCVKKSGAYQWVAH